jgi:hypothetical protein
LAAGLNAEKEEEKLFFEFLVAGLNGFKRIFEFE